MWSIFGCRIWKRGPFCKILSFWLPKMAKFWLKKNKFLRFGWNFAPRTIFGCRIWKQGSFLKILSFWPWKWHIIWQNNDTKVCLYNVTFLFTNYSFDSLRICVGCTKLFTNIENFPFSPIFLPLFLTKFAEWVYFHGILRLIRQNNEKFMKRSPPAQAADQYRPIPTNTDQCDQFRLVGNRRSMVGGWCRGGPI